MDDTKYLIVSTGRCGSTLLSAIISDAGGQFNLNSDRNWNRGSGSYEHPTLDRAYKWHRMAEITNVACWPLPKFSNYFQSYCDKNLKRVLEECTFAKTIELVWLVHSIEQLDYDFRIILSYRDFNGYAASYTRRFGWDFDKLSEHYVNVNKTGLTQMKVYGGCAISFEELTDQNQQSWAQALSELTDLNKDDLLETRNQLLKEPRHRTIEEPLNTNAAELYHELKDHQGQVFEPLTNTES